MQISSIYHEGYLKTNIGGFSEKNLLLGKKVLLGIVRINADTSCNKS